MLAKIKAFALEAKLPDHKLKAAIDGISSLLSLSARAELAAPYEAVENHQSAPEKARDAAAVLPHPRPRTKTPGSPGSKNDVRRNSAVFEWKRLGRVLKTTDRVSSIIPSLVSRTIPSWSIDGSRIVTPVDFAMAVQTLRSPYFESLKVVFLDSNFVVRHSQILTVGTLNESIAHIRDLVQALQSARAKAMDHGLAGGIMLAHNHPSGDPRPSNADVVFQGRVVGAMALLGVKVIDHVITNGETCYSFASNQVSSIDAYKQPWEVIERSKLRCIGSNQDLASLIRALRAGTEAAHIIHVNTKHMVTAIERLPLQISGDMKHWESAITEGVAREGAAAFFLDLGEMPKMQAKMFLEERVMPICRMIGVHVLDAAVNGVGSFLQEGLLPELGRVREDGPQYTVLPLNEAPEDPHQEAQEQTFPAPAPVRRGF